MIYELSPMDRKVVELTTADTPPAQVPGIRKIHLDCLRELEPQLAAAQRAIAMREYALELLDGVYRRQPIGRLTADGIGY